jgi:hypothetical protein
MKTHKQYAAGTEVPIEESRGQINVLLRDWGVSGIQWTEDFENNRVMLRFVWKHEGVPYMAKLSLNLPTDDDLREQAKHKRSGRVIEDKLENLKETRGWREHRVFYIFLKGSFEAIENGIITAEQLFLPWLVGSDGRTVGEMIAPRLPALMKDSATALLPPAKSSETP